MVPIRSAFVWQHVDGVNKENMHRKRFYTSEPTVSVLPWLRKGNININEISVITFNTGTTFSFVRQATF